MTYRIEEKKWILKRHTSNVDLLKAVAVNLKSHTKTEISEGKKAQLLQKLKELDYYKERNPEMPLDAINHRIGTLAYFMFGYKDTIDGKQRFMYSPLGNLFLKHIADERKLKKIFLTMLWAIQYPHPHDGTDKVFKLFPFRLIFKLLTDERLEYKLHAFEVAYHVVFAQEMNDKKYDELVNEILKLRQMTNEELIPMFHEKEHVLVNAVYEWDYYYRRLFKNMGIFEAHDGELICKLRQGKSTHRRVTRNFVTIPSELMEYCLKLMEKYPFDEEPLPLDDEGRLGIEVTKEIYSFYPRLLLKEIGELDIEGGYLTDLLELPRLIDEYSNNIDGEQAYLFENVLVEGFNMFMNVDARKIGGAGNTDIECLYRTEGMKFAVETKSTKNKLTNINAGRLRSHRLKIGGKYTIVITPRYVPAVKGDILGTDNVILTAGTFSEFLYNCIHHGLREIDYADFDTIIKENLGTDISRKISDFTIEKFSAISSVK
ncbi:hypothetical protein [Neobacillus sp. DY30]|uniref:hypothetical protein n=1 Tax=Neobacillus sp. DY30 TaxID=3047871 RepID=UPI0024C0D336|nr:hypothetical protein [Neobacillus sp. DY30]WHY01323.1 hypothetical protein QNH29_03470 [Neobacillus sp. DY30]